MSLSYSDLERIDVLEHKVKELEAQVRLLMDLVQERSIGAAHPVPSGDLFDLTLMSFSPSVKIGIIKIIRSVTGLGLKEAKDMSESLPCRVRTGLTASECEAIERTFAQTGARVERTPSN